MKAIFFSSLKFILFFFGCILISILWPLILIFLKNETTNMAYARLLYFIFKNTFLAKLCYLNLEKIDNNKSYIYVFNHQSFFDVVIIGLIYPKNCYIIAKNSLKYVPYFGILYYFSRNFYIKRGNSEEAQKTIRSIIQRVKNEKSSIFIFPQGTRSKDNKVTKLKRGFIQLAKATETDILPIVISSYKYTDILYHLRNKKPIYTRICEEISYKKSDDEILFELKEIMNKNISDLDSFS